MPDTNSLVIWAACAVYKMSSIFFSQGHLWEVVVGLHRPALLIFTLFQRNIYKVNVREYID